MKTPENRPVQEVKFSLNLQNGTATLSAVSDGVHALLGYSEADFLSGKMTLNQLIHADDQDIADTLFSQPTQDDEGDFNIRLRQASGRIRCMKGHSQKKVTAAGVVLDILFQDAKSLSRTMTDAALNAPIAAVMENTDDFIYFKDRNHVLTGVSQTLVDLCSPPEQEIDLVGQTDYDIFPEELADIYYRLEKQIFAGLPKVQEVQDFEGKDGRKGWVDNRKYPIRDASGSLIGLYGIARDVTERKQAETLQSMGREILHRLNDEGDLQQALQDGIRIMMKCTGFDAVGIRLRSGEDFPYIATRGFPEDFLLKENSLVAKTTDGGLCRNPDGSACLECTCGLVLSGQTDPANSIFTPGGSCWINDTFSLDKLPAGRDPRLHLRSGCQDLGYGSLALIPIRAGEEIIGLVQLADRHKGCFSLPAVEILENIAGQFGTSIRRRQVEEELSQTTDLLERTSEMAKVGGWELDLRTSEVTFSKETARIHEVDLLDAPEKLSKADQYYLPEAWPTVQAAVQAAIDHGTSYDLEIPFVTDKGRHRWVRTQGFAVREDGKTTKLRGTFQDITETKRVAVELELKEKDLEKAQQLGRMGSWKWDLASGEVVWSRELYEMYGFDPSRPVPLLTESQKLFTPESWGKLSGAMDHAVATGTSYELELEMVRKDGGPGWMWARGEVVRDPSGAVVGLRGVTIDITVRKQAEKQMAQSLADLDVTRGQLQNLVDEQNMTASENQRLLKQAATSRRALLSILEDQKKVESELRGSMRDKEALLKEVHHRVKNNLQVITSLLRLEAAKQAEPTVKDAFSDMQNRIRSMALMHETLYRTGDFAQVNLGDYLRQLSVQLFRAQSVAPDRVQLELKQNRVMVDLDQAIPCGLIVNELLTNALKHGFPEGHSGQVLVKLEQASDDQVQLQVSDTGVGLPSGFDISQSNSLGLQLVSDLTRQLQGELTIGAPAQFTIRFKHKEIHASMSPFPKTPSPPSTPPAS